MNKNLIHFEPYVHLVDVTPTTALISWGGFYFYRGAFSKTWKLAHDHQLDALGIDRKTTIGAGSEPYGAARVKVFDLEHRQVAAAETRNCNHVLIQGLQPDTEYTYRIHVNGHDFVAEQNHDCEFATLTGRYRNLTPSGRRYDLRFRTFPDDSAQVAVNVGVLGDYGVGIHRCFQGHRQRVVARALELATDDYAIKLVITTGDNVYRDISRLGGTGSEDDDWFFSFYQPYRYLLARIPFYPSVGNHDTNDTEMSEDRKQLLDNFYFYRRCLTDGEDEEIASLSPGLMYRFRYGRTAEFICLDSSFDEDRRCRYVELPQYGRFIKRALGLSEDAGPEPQWRLVYCHHPPFCAGPAYGNDEALLQSLVPMLETANQECASGYVILCGHEHNFQYSRVNGLDYFITGAGGKLRRTAPKDFSSAQTRAWAAEPHFLLLSISHESMSATPMTAIDNNRLLPLHLRNPAGETVKTPLSLIRA